VIKTFIIMTQSQILEKFDQLYKLAVNSQDPEYMKPFGTVLKDLMNYISKVNQDMAEIELEKLEAIEWEQYLTRDEATDILDRLDPDAKWGYKEWKNAMDNLGLKTSIPHVFNDYALWVVMNAEYSDQSATIFDMAFKSNKSDINDEDIIKLFYCMAVNKLTDVDGFYNVRKYFLKD